MKIGVNNPEALSLEVKGQSRIRIVQCTGRICIARHIAAHYVSTGPTSLFYYTL